MEIELATHSTYRQRLAGQRFELWRRRLRSSERSLGGGSVDANRLQGLRGRRRWRRRRHAELVELLDKFNKTRVSDIVDGQSETPNEWGGKRHAPFRVIFGMQLKHRVVIRKLASHRGRLSTSYLRTLTRSKTLEQSFFYIVHVIAL